MQAVERGSEYLVFRWLLQEITGKLESEELVVG